MDATLLEKVSEKVHEQWMETKRAQGVTSRQSERGEELMRPYPELSEQAKDLDRGSVRSVLDALARAGYVLVPGGVGMVPDPTPSAAPVGDVKETPLQRGVHGF